MLPNKCFGDNTIFLDLIILELVSPNPDTHPTFKSSRIVCWNQTTPMAAYHKEQSGRAQVAWIWSGRQHCLKRRTPTLSQLWHPRLHMPILHQNVLHGSRKEGAMGITNTFTMCSDFFARWNTTTTSSFTLRPIHTVRSCNYLNLVLLLNMNMEHLK